jgi:H+/Cl- antiporter ClcA
MAGVSVETGMPIPEHLTGSKRLKALFFLVCLKLNLTVQHFLIALAIVIGVGGGLSSILFLEFLELTQEVFLRQARGWIGVVFLLPLIPAFGGLLSGWISVTYAPEARGAVCRRS